MNAIKRAKKVIESCETFPQSRVAKTYAVLAVKQKYGEENMWETKGMEDLASSLKEKIKSLLGVEK